MGLWDGIAKVALMGVAAYVGKGLLNDRKEEKAKQEEEKKRRSSLPMFTDGISEAQFREFAFSAAKKTPRLDEVNIQGMSIELRIRSNSRLSVWSICIDFNDFGHLTGKYWIIGDENNSSVPTYFAREMQDLILYRLEQVRAAR